MKRHLLIILIFALSIIFSCNYSQAKEKRHKIKKIEQKSDISISELKQAYADVKKWQIKYYQEQMRAIALEYTGLCFKDERYINAEKEIKKINKELKQMLVK